MNIEEIKNIIKKYKYVGLIGIVIAVLIGIFGGDYMPDVTPGASKYNYQTSLDFELTVTSNDTFYLVQNTSTLVGSGLSITSFIIVPEIASGYTPADYNPVSCGLYWINANENLSIGNLSIYTGEKVVFTSDRGKSNSNLSVKCWEIPVASTVHGTVSYSFS